MVDSGLLLTAKSREAVMSWSLIAHSPTIVRVRSGDCLTDLVDPVMHQWRNTVPDVWSPDCWLVVQPPHYDQEIWGSLFTSQMSKIWWPSVRDIIPSYSRVSTFQLQQTEPHLGSAFPATFREGAAVLSSSAFRRSVYSESKKAA